MIMLESSEGSKGGGDERRGKNAEGGGKLGSPLPLVALLVENFNDIFQQHIYFIGSVLFLANI